MQVKGKYNTAKIMVDDPDYNTIQQVQLLCNLEIFKDSIIRIMADAAPCIVCPTGTSMTYNDKIVVGIPGSDIGCGVYVGKLKDKRIELAQLDKIAREQLLERKKIDNIIFKYSDIINLDSLKCKKYVDMDRIYNSLGSLGGSNHFLEIDKDYNKNLYIVCHSGSRLLGTQVAEYYTNKGYELIKKSNSNYNRAFTYIEGELLEDYLNDMHIAMHFADLNRKAIIEIITKNIKNKVIEDFTSVHNYVDTQNKILRKGAISAKLGEKMIIPINARDGALIALGKGNKEYNETAPHGAGRLFSRGDSKNMFTVNQYKKEMKGVYTSCISEATVDESPMVYKSVNYIIDNIEETAEVVDIIKPIYNFKVSSRK